MRSSRAAVLTVVAVFSFAAVLPAQAGKRTHYFELINRAHDRLVALAVAPASSDRFQPRPLGEAINGGGDSATVEWAGEQCVYDLRFTFGNGRAVVYSDIDVCRNRSLRIQPLRRVRAPADGIAVDASAAPADSAPGCCEAKSVAAEVPPAIDLDAGAVFHVATCGAQRSPHLRCTSR